MSGSPNKNGNTAYAVQYALTKLKDSGFEIKYISLSHKFIAPCIGCFKCADDKRCWQKDDMQDIIDAFFWCDGIILGSPVYFGMVSGQLKIMMDRCVSIRANYGDTMPMSGKLGGAIACANSRNGGQETTLQNLQTFMLQLNIQVISDGPIFCHSGGTIVGEASKDSWGLETVNNLSNNMGNLMIKNMNKGALPPL
ncbi:flavodoxin family protein [Pseudobacteroides cellulosolvens]|uniref:flavodoxin family protein n=1 Tax=Pseudobacteroides cellulosolvens TaxID=35825 RepID=UPI001FA6AA8E|nr:flavodoxin family protein [Pseudobacteroides cellulosolvens]